MMRNKPRHDVDASGGMQPVSDKLLRMARAATGRHEPTSAELKVARRLAQNGATWTEIHEALQWPCCLATTIRRLRKFNIFSRAGCNSNDRLARFGGRTTLPEGEVGMQVYRPRRIAQ